MTTIGIAYFDSSKLDKKKSNAYIRNAGCTTWVQELAAQWYTSLHKYCHCEVAFVDENPTEDNTCIAYGVFSESGVFRENRTFGNPGYCWIYLSITNEQRRKAEEFCKKQVGKPFDEQGVKFMPIWPSSTPTKDKWWCASFTVAVLHQIGFFTCYRTNELDVDDVVKVLESHPRRIESASPYLIKELERDFLKH